MPGIRNSSSDDRFIVYVHKNKINNKCYVGITKRTLEERVHDGYSGSRRFNCALEKYGWNNFTSEIIESNLTLEEACKKEQEYIKIYNSIENGYNLNEGGIYGLHNEETIKKMSERMIGNTLSKSYIWTEEAKLNVSKGLRKHYDDPIKGAETRRKQSESHKGKKISNSTRKLLSEKLKGRKFSEETLEKMRYAACNRSEETNKKISISKKGVPLSEQAKKNISNALKGKKRTPEQREHYRQAALNRSKEHQDKINDALRKRNERRISHG